MTSIPPSSLLGCFPPHKKLKRMPHIFSRVLELPCDANALVDVIERQASYVFVIEQPGLVADEVRVEVVEIVPGAVKVVIHGSCESRGALEELEVDLWRFRLPSCTLPEATTATYLKGVLTVTVPKMSSSPSIEARSEKAAVEYDNESSLKREDTHKLDGPGSGLRHDCGVEPDKDVKYSFGDDVQSATCTTDLVKYLVEAIAGLLVGKALYDGAAPIFSSLLKVDLPNSLNEGDCMWDWAGCFAIK